MKRRTMLGLAATALAGCGGEDKPPTAVAAGVKCASKPGDRMCHDVTIPNNYGWGENNPAQYQAQMLALNMMIFQGTNPKATKGFFFDFQKYAKHDDVPAAHPFYRVDARIYDDTRTYCDHELGWPVAREKLYAAAVTLNDFAEAGLARTPAMKRRPEGKFAYTSPDECPCDTYDDANPFCATVDPLL
jgi:hypothetical protein